MADRYASRTALWTVVVDTLAKDGWGAMLPKVSAASRQIDLEFAVRMVDEVYDWLVLRDEETCPHGSFGLVIAESLQQMIDEEMLPATGMWRGQGKPGRKKPREKPEPLT